MTDFTADPVSLPGAPRRDLIGWTILASVAVHLLIFGILMLPRLPLAEPPGPPAVNVDIVTSSELASLESSSAPPSVEPSKEASSSQPAQSPSSEASAASSSAAPSAASAAPASSTAASSEPPPDASASSRQAPKPFPAPRAEKVVIPVGPADSSSEAASSDAASEASTSEASAAAASSAPVVSIDSLLTASGDGGGVADASAPDASASSVEPLPMKVMGGGRLHAARHFYLKEMLASPMLSQARQALKQLPPERRLAQTCNIEASGQIGASGFSPDAIIANAFAAPALSGLSYAVSGGAFRADGQWYRIAYECTLNADMSNVASFSFHIGEDVTAEMTARLSSNGQ